MSLMPDPTDILLSLQQTLDNGMPVDTNELNTSYVMFYDEPFVGGKRYIFGKIVNREIQAASIFGLEDPIEGIECYNVGYAVLKKFQGQGLAVEAVNIGLDSLRSELSRTGLKRFYVEAVIDITNTHSINVAKKLFSQNGVKMIERDTGTPSLYFQKLIVLG